MSHRFARIRSPLLRTLGERTDPETPGILRRRRAAIAIAVTMAVAIVFLVRAGRFPSPALDLLYVLHDSIALPLWGYTWTLLAPYSITWWSLGGIAFLIWLVTYLTRRSAVRALHARLSRFVVVHLIAQSGRSPRRVARLTAGVDWLAARGLGAELLRDVVRLEQTEALMAIVGASTLDEATAWRLVRLTDLLATLTSHAAATPRQRWRAVAIWHQAFMWIDHRAGSGSRTAGVRSIVAGLAATGRTLLNRLDGAEHVDADALSIGLRRDLQDLVEHAEDRTFTPTNIIRSVLERLDASWALAERGSGDDDASALATKAPDSVLEVQGVLVASIGLHAASREDDAHLAEAHLEAFEALSFVTHLGTAGRDAHRVARALTAEAPERDHYRLVADLTARRRARLAASPAVGRQMLDEAAGYERMRIGALHDAADRTDPDTSGRDLRSRLQWRIRFRPLALRTRVDPVLLAGLAGTSVVYCTAAALLVLLLSGSVNIGGWSARELPDRRFLENVRRGLDANPFLDAVFHAPDRQLVVSQRGGVLHSYDPATGLWSTARPFGPNDLVQSDIRLLASTNDDSGALWGVTAGGGLVRRTNGRWQVVVGDTKFIGRRGTPVQQDDLSAAAASSDGKWLLAAAGADGVGVQDTERRRWLPRDEMVLDGSPSAVTHAVWWQDRFYVGGPEGVAELSIDRRPLTFRPVNGLAGTVTALEASAADGLFVHQTVPCETGPATCARLARMTHPLTAPSVLIDERNRYGELSLDRLFYAVQWKDHLLLAGSSGIFDYDVRQHAWRKQAAETVSAIGQCATASCFYYGYGGRAPGVALFTPSTMDGSAPRRWPLAGEQPIRIAAETPDTAAVLTAAGRAYALGSGAASTLINPAASSPVPLDRYRDAVTFGDKVLFFGPSGALLHDVIRRSYSPLRAVPEWLRSPASIVAASGALLFGLERRATSYDVHVVPQQQVELGTLVFNTAAPFRIDGPVRGVDASRPDALRLIDANGGVQSIAASGVTPLTGGRSNAMAGARLLDVAGTADALAAATTGGVRVYSTRTRSWSDPLPAPPGERVVELVDRAGTWIGRSDANRLMQIGASSSVLIGGGEPMPMRSPTDARQSGSDIYLSWPGTILRYDLRTRQVAASWKFDAAGPTTLAGIAGSEPLSVADGVARAGTREIARGVREMLTSGAHVWLTREDRGRRYLETRPLAAAPRFAAGSCLYRTPGAGADAGVLHDVRRLSNGVVAVTTDGGLKLHSRDRHSWYSVDGLLPKTGRDTLATIGSALLLWEWGGTLQIVRAPVTLPDSCSTAPARVEVSDRISARAVAIDERAGVAYVVRNDGRVDRVDESSTRPVIARENQGPPEAEIVRSWHFPDTAPSVLWVATRKGLWQYDLGSRFWSEWQLQFPFSTRRSEPMSLDLESSAGQLALFVTIGADTFRGAVANEPGRTPTITLVPAGPRGDHAPQPPVFRIGAVTFSRDVSQGQFAVLEQSDGRSIAAYRDRAFLWDRGRRGIAIAPEGALLLGDAGVHAAESSAAFSNFDPGPPGTPSPSDRLTSGPDLVPRMLRGNRWYRRVAAGVWEPAPPPANDAVLAHDDGLVWRRRSGSIVVESITGAPVPISAGAQGPELATDRLVAAAPYDGGAALLTTGFVELIESRPAAPFTSRGAVLPAPAADTIESATINGREVMWLTRSGAASRWNRDRLVFEPTTERNPFERRTLAEIGPLRLSRAGASIEGALQIVDVHGRISWTPIDLSTGRFPFDIVRSIAVVGGALYVGTDAGLQIYDTTDVSLERARLMTLAADIAASPAVERVGESCDTPGTVVLCGPRGCARQTAPAAAFAAAAADALSCRLRARSPFWSWQDDGSGLSGRYTITSVPGASAATTPVTLADGLLPHDDIEQVVSFGDDTFTVWQDRLVSIHPTALALAGATSHAFASPVRLLNVTTPIPLPGADNRDVAPGLYAIENISSGTDLGRGRDGAGSVPAPSPSVWRYDKQTWTIVADARIASTIADTAINPPLLQRKRLRLVRPADRRTPVFETRTSNGDWTPLTWDASAGRFSLDVWQSIAVHQKALWIATPAGFVSLDGNWSFNPDTFRLVGGPVPEAGRTATDLRADGSGLDVRYDGARAWRVAIDAAGSQPAVRLERDPFAEQTFDVDTRYWQWRITGRTGVSAGRLAGTWQGEPIAVVNGRFDFDAINSMALFQGLLHVATSTRGWFTLPLDSAALEHLSRPSQPSISPLEVAKLHGNRDADEPELCLEGADGQFTRLSPGGAIRRTQGCPVLAARTGFWRYTRDGSTFRILPGAAAARPGERRLVDGRFTDDVITGPPVTGLKSGRSLTLVPTAAGLMWWDGARQVVDMHAPPFQGKADVPRLLHWPSGDSPSYLADGTLYAVEHDDAPRGSWTVRIPPKAVFERLGNGPGPLLTIDWSEDGRRHQSLVDPRNGSISHDDIAIDARRIPAYFQRAMTEASYDGLIRLRLRDRVVAAYATSEGWPIVEADDSFQLLAGVAYGTRAILVGPRDLVELNMELIARAVYSGRHPPSPGGSGKDK